MLLSIVVLAAGKGTRMGSKNPKVFHNVGNYPMIYHVLKTAKSLIPKNLVIVVSSSLNQYLDDIKQKFKNIDFAIQAKQLGTGDAIKSALKISKFVETDVTLILYGDTPLISKQTLKNSLLNFQKKKMDLCILSMRPRTNENSYGKLKIENGKLKKIIESSESTLDDKKIQLCNSGIMIIKTDLLKKNLGKIKSNNSKREFFLTDIVEIMSKSNFSVDHIECNYVETLGINDKVDLSKVEFEFQNIFRRKVLAQGVSLIDPKTIYFSFDTKIGTDSIIYPNVFFGPGVTIGKNVIIKSFSHIENAEIYNDSSIGPFARIRDHTKINKDVKIGNFVEIKKSTIKDGVKISHLSYVGDAMIGENTNIGAGTITCNFDGVRKNKTFIGPNCLVGSNSSLIAPLKVEKNSIIGAGTVVNKDISNNLTVYRRSELVKKKNK